MGAASGLNMSPGAISESSLSHLPATVASTLKQVSLVGQWIGRAASASPTPRPASAYCKLNANQLSSGGDAKSHQTEGRDEQLKRREAAAGLPATKIANLHHTNEVPSCAPNMG
jgi:hypothetical protein